MPTEPSEPAAMESSDANKVSARAAASALGDANQSAAEQRDDGGRKLFQFLGAGAGTCALPGMAPG